MKHFLSGLLNAIIITSVIVTTWQIAAASEANMLDRQNEAEAYCMAMNIYHEARGSSFADQVATADVVLNRVQDTRYPNTICEVVHQGPVTESWKQDGTMVPVRNQCQFSWWCDGRDDTPHNTDLWVAAQSLAYAMVVDGRYRGITEGATHYHATYVNPRWASSLHLVGRIGEHIYYRWD